MYELTREWIDKAEADLFTPCFSDTRVCFVVDQLPADTPLIRQEKYV